MALYQVFARCYSFDIMNYTNVRDSWGIGVVNCNNYDKQIAPNF
jgi:hypothetical protein